MLCPPPQRFHRSRSCKQRKEDKRNVEDRVFQIEHALTEVFEVGDDRKVIDHLGGHGCVEGREPAQQPQQQASEECDTAGDDLVPGGGGDESPDGQQAAALQSQPEVGHQHRFEVRLAPGKQQRDVDHQHGQDAGVQEHGAEPLAEDDLGIGHGRGKQEVDGAGPFLFGEEPHGDHGDEEQRHGGGEAEQRADDLLVDVHGLALAHHLGLEAEADEVARGGVKAKAEYQPAQPQDRIGYGRREIALEFLLTHEEHVFHFLSPSLTWSFCSAAVSWRKMSSRLRPTARNSLRFQPELTTVRASSARMWRPCRLSISKVSRPFLESFMTTRLTPATCSRRWSTSLGLGWPSAASTSSATASDPRRRLVRLVTVSMATSLPRSMMMTCSQECSTSERMWVLRMMVCSPASDLSSSRISMICLGSRPEVGSSRIRTGGLWMMAWARPTRWRNPLESLPMRRVRTSPMAQRPTTSSRRRARSAEGMPLSLPTKVRYSITSISG